MNNYLKAYTIMEVLLTLVISSVVITMVYTVFLYLDQQLVNYQKRTEALQDYYLFEAVVKRDLYLCDSVITFEEGNQIDLINYDQSVVSYRKDGQTLYRKTEGQQYTPIGLPLLSWKLEKTLLPNKEGHSLNMVALLDRDTLSLQFAKMKTAIQINP